ncbi:MAG: Rieske (2Fe-2S) protein [Acetobacteraceae bacterium]
MTALPEEWYDSPDIWIAERRALFERSWQVVARSLDLPHSGSYRATAIGGLGVFAMRQDDGSVLGFRNLCRHQGMPVLAAGAGRCAQIRCPYHGWTYRLDGTLADTPPLVVPDDQADVALRGIGAREQDGFVLLHFNPDAGSDPCLAALAGLAPAAEPIVIEIEACNWKQTMERALKSPGVAAWGWPNLVIHTDAVLIAQPRGFRRTELIRLPIEPAPTTSADALGAFLSRVRALHGRP